MREITERVATRDVEAGAALDGYVHRLRAGIAAMTAAMGGLDVLAFTGGVGENSAMIRRLACEGLEYLGVHLDEAANEAAAGDAPISATNAAVHTVVVRAREDLAMSRQARRAIARH